MGMIYQPSSGLWFPPRVFPEGFISPSPPAAAREARCRALVKERTTYRGRVYLPGVPGYLEPIEAMPFLRSPNLTGGMQDLSGIEMQLLGSGAPAITAPTAFYRLEDKTDSGPSGFTLSDYSTATFGAGKIGNCCNNFDTSHGLFRSDSLPFRPGSGAFSMWGWANATFLGSTRFFPIVAKWTYGGNREFAFGYDAGIFGGTGWGFAVSNTGSSNDAVAHTSTASTGTWYFVAAWYDLTHINISVNAGAPVQAAFSSSIFNGGNDWAVGRTMDDWRGSLDAVAWWKGYAITTTEVTAGYASGNGTEYYSSAWH